MKENKNMCFGCWGQDNSCAICEESEFCYQRSTGDMSFSTMVDIDFKPHRGDVNEQLILLLGLEQWRERAIIMMVLQGMKNLEIAISMRMSERLVVAIITKIRKRLPRVGHAMSCMRRNSRLKKNRIKS